MHDRFIRQAIELSRQAIRQGTGGPFGAVVVKNGDIIGEGQNRVLERGDPTAHAEIVAIQDACRHLNHYELNDCRIYTSCEPCPMCLGAIYWSRLDMIYYAANRKDAAAIGFDDAFFYDELHKDRDQRCIRMVEVDRDGALEVMKEYDAMEDKQVY